MGAGDPRGDRGDQAEVHRDDGRLERSPVDPRASRHHPGDTGPSVTARRIVQRDAGPGANAAARSRSDPATPDAADPERAENSPSLVAPEPQPKAGTTTTTTYRIHEFRTDEWAAYYSKRIDATIAALKSAGVPVFWVGLPSIRGPKSTSDMQYLNDLYRARAEKAGITYIDVWDGFVDDSGRFTPQGPDFEGQIRRLRAGDGVHFTKAGARKLAHYVEREIRRVMTPGSEPVALPSSEPLAPAAAAKPSGPAARPLAGPVVPLTASATSAQELIGPRDTGDTSSPKSVTRVLVNGEAISPPAGRSDDFRWPRRAIAPFGTDPVVATTTEPIPVMRPAPATTVAAPNAEIRPVAAANPGVRRTATTGRAPSQQPPQSARSSRLGGDGRSLARPRGHRAVCPHLCQQIQRNLERGCDRAQRRRRAGATPALDIGNVALADVRPERQLHLRHVFPFAQNANRTFAVCNAVHDFLRKQRRAGCDFFASASDEFDGASILVGLGCLGDQRLIILARQNRDLAFGRLLKSNIHIGLLVIDFAPMSDSDDDDRSLRLVEDDAPVADP